MRRLALVVAMVLPLGGLPASGAHGQVPEDTCSLNVYIAGLQFWWQGGVILEDGSCVYTRVMQPAGFLSVPYSSPVGINDIPHTFWIRNITNLDPITHVFDQCGGAVLEAQCVRVPAPHVPGVPMTVPPGQTRTFPPASNERYGFPDCVKYIWFYSQSARWMRGVIINEGWFRNSGDTPCP